MGSLESWPNIELSVILFLPDAMKQGLWEELSDELIAKDISVCSALPLLVKEDVLARIYQNNRKKEAQSGRIDGTWLSPNLFELDNSILTIVKWSRENGDLTEYLSNWKGTSDYFTRDNASLRSVSKIAQKSFSVLHTFDSGDELAQVLDSILPISSWELSQIVKDADSNVKATDLGKIRGYLPPGSEKNPYDIVLRLMIRIASLLELDIYTRTDSLSNWIREVDRLREESKDVTPSNLKMKLIGALDSLGSSLENLSGPQAIFSVSDKVNHAIYHRIVDERTQLYEGLKLLSDTSIYNAKLAQYLHQVCTSNQLYSDNLERHMITTALTHYNL